MLIIPGIDLKDGKCVRLYQGDYSQVTVFSDDPAQVGQRWRDEGAQYLHVVDLDGSKAGRPVNLEVIAQIKAASGLPVEVGGGIRNEATALELLGKGVDRVILGTAALRDPEMTGQLCQKYGEKIVIGIDARNGLVAVEGWTETSGVLATDLARQLVQLGAQRFIYTDISRDGTLTEPNYAAFTEFAQAAGKPVIASGGVARTEQVRKLAELGAEGVIIGRALYTGDVKMADLLVV
ncbi:MAG: 1-(5-phosphoribosyl)-5-[(5-phosphoribosylamino)methylideneamino]imidazole-4-carboxamide isomerase [Chloroflexi bacterium]|nr:1-(5-phosphoribosyl)-5-[(5-phosphoribosylamino)methylideneamino]imidazole-4-carboxamide isomerase [Chloroflexota bacterium]OJV95293.1 MAG: 1-(5-phosphoribosyl)-5-[(5-phosphoribosylamino)methylideneamino]imidazole-4-carboxamide isomerase [Chloroflexi bacterium 54-19]